MILQSIEAPAIGQYWEGQGGLYAGIMPDYVGHEPKHLIFSVDEAVDIEWGTGYSPEATSRTDGAANTQALLAQRMPHPAAKWADDYEKDGHTDFHLPSIAELDVAYVTMPERFVENDMYWSSTDRNAAMVHARNFGDMDMPFFFKVFAGRARAVRTVPV